MISRKHGSVEQAVALFERVGTKIDRKSAEANLELHAASLRRKLAILSKAVCMTSVGTEKRILAHP
jgi:hypothetical protein